MIREGAPAPAVSLPAYENGDRTRVDLGEYIGEGIVVLAFYPADFNPGCTMQESDLDDLDLFTMQKDVSVFAVSPDSTYSHEAFAERYSLHIPLLSDVDGEAAAAYGVATETDRGERLVERAVFVVDHRGEVRYAWATDDLEAGFDVGPVKDAIGAVGGDDTALERYRVGHDSYAEGREAFTAAMSEYEDREWMVARTRFEEAEPAFAAAADSFDTAVRFAETDDFETVVDRAEEKADTLQHAANWLADSADALASGRGKQGQEFRDDAQRLLDAAADLPDPPEPAAVELVGGGIELADSVVVDPDGADEGYAWRADDEGAVDTDLGVDDAALDAAVAADDESGPDDRPREAGASADDASPVEGDTVQGNTIEGDTVEGDLEMDLSAVEAADPSDETPSTGAGDPPGETPSTGAGDSPDETPSAGTPDHGTPAGTDERPPTGTGTPGDDTGDGPPLTRGGSSAGDPVADRAAADGAATDTEAIAGDAENEAADGETGDDETGDGEGDGTAEVEELDLTDPTENEDEQTADERADWDIPGQ